MTRLRTFAKQLRVEFTVNGQPQSEVVQENESLETLPASAVVTRAVYGKLPAEKPNMDLTRKLALMVAGNGELNVRADNNTLAGRDPAWLKPEGIAR